MIAGDGGRSISEKLMVWGGGASAYGDGWLKSRDVRNIVGRLDGSGAQDDSSGERDRSSPCL
jgi:hypothetical protein